MPYRVIVAKGGKIGVGFETSKMDVKHMRRLWRQGGGGTGGGKNVYGARGGRPNGGKNGSSGKGEMDGQGKGFKKYKPKSLELWITIKLASEPADRK